MLGAEHDGCTWRRIVFLQDVAETGLRLANKVHLDRRLLTKNIQKKRSSMFTRVDANRTRFFVRYTAGQKKKRTNT